MSYITTNEPRSTMTKIVGFPYISPRNNQPSINDNNQIYTNNVQSPYPNNNNNPNYIGSYYYPHFDNVTPTYTTSDGNSPSYIHNVTPTYTTSDDNSPPYIHNVVSTCATSNGDNYPYTGSESNNYPNISNPPCTKNMSKPPSTNNINNPPYCGLNGVTYDHLPTDQPILHCGECGYCSNIHDIKIYNETRNTLTNTARKCAHFYFVPIIGESLVRNCMKRNVGFTQECNECWVNDVKCSFSNCLVECLSNPDKCIECNETKCGPSFKECVGANRRRTGIITDIYHPDNEMCTIMDSSLWK